MQSLCCLIKWSKSTKEIYEKTKKIIKWNKMKLPQFESWAASHFNNSRISHAYMYNWMCHTCVMQINWLDSISWGTLVVNGLTYERICRRLPFLRDAFDQNCAKFANNWLHYGCLIYGCLIWKILQFCQNAFLYTLGKTAKQK